MGASSRTTYSPNCLCCELLAHKWTPQIVAVLLAGPRRFSAFQVKIPTLSDKVLSRRLAWLEQVGLVSREQYSEIPPRVEYTLTEAGLALEPVIAEMERWSNQFGRDSNGGQGRPIDGSLPLAFGRPRAIDGLI